MHHEGERTTNLSERARGWLGFALFVMLGGLFLLFLPFLTWPGYGSTIHISPLDRFLLAQYPLWYLMCGFFALGAVIELFPMWVFTHLFFTIAYPLDREGTKPDLRTKAKALAVTGIGILPGIVYLILVTRRNPFIRG